MILALDVGEKRVGTAMGDEKTCIAFPHRTFATGGGVAEREIIRLIKEKEISQLVVGMPLNEDGSYNAQCQKVDRFSQRLRRRASVQIIYMDEYLSTWEVKEKLALTVKKEIKFRRSGLKDALSASHILQAFFENSATAKTRKRNSN